MEPILEAVILGIVQGVTEWLPVSSSGHLVLFQHLFGIEQPVIYDVVLHLGSLLVIFLVFWADIIALCKGVVRRERKYIEYALFLAIATIPIGLVGILLNDLVKSAFTDIRTVGVSLLLTACVLYLSQFPKEKNRKIGLKNAVLIGLAQAIAILPGVSRSGVTISAGMMQGVDKEEAARFSFLMFIPAILGATLVEVRNIGAIADPIALGIGTLVSVVAGFFSLKLLLRAIRENHFSKFMWYCLGLGMVILLFLG